MIDVGTEIDGRYRVLSKIGSGGMADVYLAEDQLLGRKVAVKVLHHRFAEDQEFVERFRREAQSAAGLSHPNVVAIFDRGEWDGTYYIAMEYLPGRSLKSIVGEQGPLDPLVAVDIVIQILHAARFAHRRGIIHRDLKPHNVILDEEGRAKVTDFGIARAGASDMTLTGSIMGTAQYLSPEQAQGQLVSEASDLYAIGIVLYELLTGSIPFDGETAVSIALKQVSAPPPVPSVVNPAVSPALDAVVLRALAKDPAARFANADEFIAALEFAVENPGSGVHAAAAAGLVAAGASMYEPATAVAEQHTQIGMPAGPLPPPTPPAGLTPPPPRRRRRWMWLWIALGVLLLAVAGVAAYFALRTPSVPVPPLRGLDEQQAASRLHQVGLIGRFSPTPDAEVMPGHVVRSNPAQGVHLKEGSHVTVYLSSGPGRRLVPDVAQSSLPAAKQSIEDAGFHTHVIRRYNPTIERGFVIETEPPGGTRHQAGSTVVLVVSRGPAPLTVPNLVGLSLNEAELALVSAELERGTIKREVSTSAPGTVIAQDPSSGTLPAGSRVNLVVARRNPEVTVPFVLGDSETSAIEAILQAELEPVTRTRTVHSTAENGMVLQQNPRGGSSARRHSDVTIVVGEYVPRERPEAGNEPSEEKAEEPTSTPEPQEAPETETPEAPPTATPTPTEEAALPEEAITP